MGKVGRETLGVEKMLRRIGFHYCNRIDPFDGGPHFRAATDEILLVRRSRRLRAVAGEPPPASPKALVGVDLRESPFFRATAGPVSVDDARGAVTVAPAVLESLQLADGAEVWVLPLD